MSLVSIQKYDVCLTNLAHSNYKWLKIATRLRWDPIDMVVTVNFATACNYMKGGVKHVCIRAQLHMICLIYNYFFMKFDDNRIVPNTKSQIPHARVATFSHFDCNFLVLIVRCRMIEYYEGK